MSETKNGLSEADRREPLEYGRHYDNLVWIVTSLMTGANAALMAIAGDNLSKPVGSFGILLTVLTVFYAAGFRSIRRRIRRRLTGDNWLVGGPEEWYLKQWFVYVCSFCIVTLLWTLLLLRKFPEDHSIWWSMCVISLIIMFGLWASDRDTVKSCRVHTLAEKLYIVHLKGAQDPEDKAYRQPVRASNVEVSGETLIFSHSDGTLSAFFDMSAVNSWAEADESQLRA